MAIVMARGVVGMRKWALAVAIAVIFNLFVNYGIATFYKAPDYNDFCDTNYPRGFSPMVVKPNCSSVPVPDSLQANCTGKTGFIRENVDDFGCVVSYYCDPCQVNYEGVNDAYQGNVFFILVLIGVAAVVAGVLLPVESVGLGFLTGGIFSILIGTVRNWSNLTDVIRFVILGILLAVLVLIGWKKARD